VLDSGSVKPLLQVVNLSVVYRDSSGARADALHAVNLKVNAGEVVGVMGPSGSGKSTLALAILGALPARASVSGVVEYSGSALAPIFQEPLRALHPMLTAGRQVAEVARARGCGKSRIAAEAALEQVGLEPREVYGAWPHQLSGGQRQRVLIAQAIVGGPELVIADEPTASLDSVARAGIMTLLQDLKTRLALAMIFNTHSEELLAGFADRVVTMRAGRLMPAAS
jgi:ABC-type glutathione transport system ATPase component